MIKRTIDKSTEEENKIMKQTDMEELDQQLLEEAKRARTFSYSPYSSFAVGAAIRTKAGKVYRGCNIENRSLGITNCAERTAIFNAISAGEREFEALAVAAAGDTPVPPCGACRQVIAEFGIRRILMSNLEGEVQVVSCEELLPGAFSRKNMK